MSVITAPRGTQNAPNTLWDLICVQLRTPTNRVLNAYLPLAWSEEAQALLENDATAEEFNRAFWGNTPSDTETVGWFTSCLLRDRSLNDFNMETRCQTLIRSIEAARDSVVAMSPEAINKVLDKISHSPSRDIDYLLTQAIASSAVGQLP